MRFLSPSADTRPTYWRDWEQRMNEVSVYEWKSWNRLRGTNEQEIHDILLYPCKTCSEICRYMPSELEDPIDCIAGGKDKIRDIISISDEELRWLYYEGFHAQTLTPRPEGGLALVTVSETDDSSGSFSDESPGGAIPVVHLDVTRMHVASPHQDDIYEKRAG